MGLVGLGFLGVLGGALVFGVAATVFNTVLYHWATSGSVPEGFDGDMLRSAFAVRP